MQIDQAIEYLQTEKRNGVKNVVIAWWDAGMFERVDDEAWEHDAELIERRMDWGTAHDEIQSMLDMIEATAE